MENNKNNFNQDNDCAQDAQSEETVKQPENQDAEMNDASSEGEMSAEDLEELTLEGKIKELEDQLAKEKREYLFLMAEFDNFRKRTLKEKSEIIRNAGENVLKGLLPVMDDFERCLKAAESGNDSEAMKEGVTLIYNKLKKYLASNGVKEFDPADDTFDADKHEAISVVPVPDETKKGKILDTVEKGYMINDKVLRHAKVVVAQ